MTQIKKHLVFELPNSPKSQLGLFPDNRLPRFPSTRYQGSKRKLLPELANAFRSLSFESAIDLYSGSGMVTLLLRYLGKRVDANDYQRFNQSIGRLFLRVNQNDFDALRYKEELTELLTPTDANRKSVVTDRYKGIFFTNKENAQIDHFCQGLPATPDIRRDLYIYAVGQALMKKRPYNLFHRANLSMRQRDVKRSFGNAVTWETPIVYHAIKAIEELKAFPFDELPKTGEMYGENTTDLRKLPSRHDLVYLDPPYLNSKGVGVDYSDFYSFLEGLCDYSLFASGDANFPHLPMDKKRSNWLRQESALEELSNISRKWTSSIIVLSYRSDGLPTPDETKEALSQNGRRVEIHSCGEYKYALSRTSSNEELFLISLP